MASASGGAVSDERAAAAALARKTKQNKRTSSSPSPSTNNGQQNKAKGATTMSKMTTTKMTTAARGGGGGAGQTATTRTLLPSPASRPLFPLLPLPHVPPVSSFSTLGEGSSGLAVVRRLPNRWVDFFCIVGLDRRCCPGHQGGGTTGGGGDNSGGEGENARPRRGGGGAAAAAKSGPPVSSQPPPPQRPPSQQEPPQYRPIVLDSYPSHRPDMEFPEQIATFCFPHGCHPIKIRNRSSRSRSTTPTTSSARAAGTMVIKQNLPDPTLCTIVLTTGSGRRLYGTTLIVYEEWDMERDMDMDMDFDFDLDTNSEVKASGGKSPSSPRERPPKRLKKNKAGKQTGSPTGRDQEERQSKSTNDSSSHTYLVPKSYVLLSHYPFFHAQATMLKELFYTVQSGASPVPIERFVAHMVDDVPLPSPPGRTKVEWHSWTTKAVGDGTTLSLQVPSTTAILHRPPPNKLPLLNVASYEPLFRTLSLSNILVLWATLLQEGRVVLCCSSKDTVALLTPIAQALVSLLFPLEWQGMYVPLLPNPTGVDGESSSHSTPVAMDILDAPVPYLVGLCLPRPTGDQKKNQHRHHHRPPGVVWCDLEKDVVHLGWTDNGSVREGVPSLPEAASMRLKAELEEVADPLFLPPSCGIKGRMTVGGDNNNNNNNNNSDRYLDNAARDPPYAPMTRLFHDGNPRPTPRTYILTQASKVPPRGRVLRCEDFSLSDDDRSRANTNTNNNNGHHIREKKSKSGGFGTLLCPIVIIDDDQENQVPTTMGSEPMSGTASGDDVADNKGKTDRDNDEGNPSFFASLKRQSRSIQAHTDRFMSVLGQNFATPSQYANMGDYMGDDILQQQDEIAARLFDTNEALAETVRQCFLRFFVHVLSPYKDYVDEETQRLDVPKFARSLRLSQRGENFVKEMVQTQMFELFLQDSECNQRRYFDETIIRHQTQRSKSKSPPTPFLDSTKWRLESVVTPPPPCSAGVRKGQVFLSDRRFPDHLDPAECVTSSNLTSGDSGCCSNTTCDVASWRDPFCSAFLSCGGYYE